MFCASVAYPLQKDGTFDFDYFVKRHVPMFAHFLGENCVRFEVQKSLASPVLLPQVLFALPISG